MMNRADTVRFNARLHSDRRYATKNARISRKNLGKDKGIGSGEWGGWKYLFSLFPIPLSPSFTAWPVLPFRPLHARVRLSSSRRWDGRLHRRRWDIDIGRGGAEEAKQ